MAAEPDIQIGDYQFALRTATPHTSERSTERRWASVARMGKLPALQDIGPGADRLSLKCTVYPEFAGAGLGQAEALRSELDKGEPLDFVDRLGNVYGAWVLKSVRETQSHRADGIPKRIDIDLELERYDDETTG